MEINIDRRRMLKGFLENIACISDERYQAKTWIRAEGPECDDIDDSICDFFDDGDLLFKKHKDFGISEIQYKKLMLLYQKLRVFADTYDVYNPYKCTEKLIQLPQWQEIRDLAKKVLVAFNN